MKAAERERAAREEAMRRSRLSLRLGTLGVVLLFLGGVGVILFPGWTLYLLVAMVAGILLVGVAFLLVRSSVLTFTEVRTKNL